MTATHGYCLPFLTTRGFSVCAIRRDVVVDDAHALVAQTYEAARPHAHLLSLISAIVKLIT